MRAPTKKLLIKDESIREDDLSISAEDFIKESFGHLPMWSISLAGLRHRDGLTQKALAEMIEVKQSNISQMERGLRPIGKNIAKRLAKVFNCDYRDFL